MAIRRNLLWVLVAGLLLLLAVAPTASAQDEGIKVHGDWVIEVLNPDGTLVTRHEFKNALTADGKQFLANLLAQQVQLVATHVDLWIDNGAGYSAVRISKPPNGNLVVSTDPSAGPVNLSGSTSNTGSANWVIGFVGTAITECNADCSTTRVRLLTRRDLTDGPITIAPGQIIQVTVRLSFS